MHKISERDLPRSILFKQITKQNASKSTSKIEAKIFALTDFIRKSNCYNMSKKY